MKKKIYRIDLNEQRNRFWLVEVWVDKERIYPTKPREKWDGTTKEGAREEGITALRRRNRRAEFTVNEIRYED
jgi:hypothetical protein